jgi:hypothetical protein
MTDLRLSRRAVTRALATLPIIAVPAAGRAVAAPEGDTPMNMVSKISAPVVNQSAWDRAMQVMLRAEEKWRSHNANVCEPLEAEAEVFFGKPHYLVPDRAAWARRDELDAAEKRSDTLCASFVRAEASVYRTEAPTRTELLWKLERSLDDTDNGDLAYHAGAILSDCRRLLGEG